MCKLSDQVPFTVECNMGRFWVVIAAFNVDSVAKWYADDCQKTNPHFKYRVRMVLD